jgi:hypothetical protein
VKEEDNNERRARRGNKTGGKRTGRGEKASSLVRERQKKRGEGGEKEWRGRSRNDLYLDAFPPRV